VSSGTIREARTLLAQQLAIAFAEWVVLAQHQGHERKGKAWKHFHQASPIFTELSY
jgi:hypothetical protein